MIREFTGPCPVCGGVRFSFVPVLWTYLIEAWQLNEEETDYVNRQQGFHCTECRNNLRSMALGTAFLSSFGLKGTLSQAVNSPVMASVRILEVNQAGDLGTFLSKFPHHRLISYPEYDLCSLRIQSETIDCVVHSDVLEHVSDPLRGLEECRRILAPGGKCIFTVPIIINRLTRSRSGLPPSYHGSPNTLDSDFLVHSEFGANIWSLVLSAGFCDCRIIALEHPAGLAIVASG